MHDLLITNGHLVDGTGAPLYRWRRRHSDGSHHGTGRVDGRAAATIDADGRLVTPGVVDIHTHYHGQAFWDGDLSPSCWHGVTTVVMGNCSVGFAPVLARTPRLAHRDDGERRGHPVVRVAPGHRWSWETFLEFLDAPDRPPRVMDVGTQVPHAAVRGYVIGDAALANEPATPDDIAAMAAIVLRRPSRAGVPASRPRGRSSTTPDLDRNPHRRHLRR